MFWGKKTHQTGTDTDEIKVNIDKSWSDDHGIFLKGWILLKTEKPDQVHITVGSETVSITDWHPRPDIVLANPQYSMNVNCGFSAYVPCLADHWILIKVQTRTEIITKSLHFQGSSPQTPTYTDVSNLFNEFVQIVNENHFNILEIGSRIVSPGSCSKRPLFFGAESYTGFDIYPDSNTDVVGDAHKLSQYFGDRKFDAVFSLSVFEHLAMPWVVAKEINKVMKVGGISYHQSHFSWPLHEMPWDFFRFSDEGFKSLFLPSMGFETIKSGLFSPMRMYFDSVPAGQEELPFFSGFGGAAILVKKNTDVDCDRFSWETTIEENLGSESRYPKKEN